MKFVYIFFLFSLTSFAQKEITDSLGNFYVIKNKLNWIKHYQLDDINELDRQLRENAFTSNLRILDFETSAVTNAFQLNANGLPQYAQSDYTAFISIDIYHDSFRVTINDVSFPDFVVEDLNYNAISRNSRGGTLDYYNLKQGEEIKRINSTVNVLYSFDKSFEEIFDSIAVPIEN